MHVLENALREDLNERAERRMAVLRPLKVIIENYPEGETESLDAANHPQKPELGTRTIPFSREIYVERDDFLEDPPKDFYRLGPGREVRLRFAYFITCTGVVKDPKTGEVTQLRCTYDPKTRGGNAPDPPSGGTRRKVKGTIHWVDAKHAADAEVRLYDNLFTKEIPDEVDQGQDFLANLNPNSLEVVRGSKLEPALAEARPGDRFQFERLGYFAVDAKDSRPGKPVFNRAVTLREGWK
jgi:glutaminyl-tRNA synthetase